MRDLEPIAKRLVGVFENGADQKRKPIAVRIAFLALPMPLARSAGRRRPERHNAGSERPAANGGPSDKPGRHRRPRLGNASQTGVPSSDGLAWDVLPWRLSPLPRPWEHIAMADGYCQVLRNRPKIPLAKGRLSRGYSLGRSGSGSRRAQRYTALAGGLGIVPSGACRTARCSLHWCRRGSSRLHPVVPGSAA